jgi:predicted nucleic acid-binding protein
VEPAKAAVLDANILLSYALGVRARHLVDVYAGEVWFCAPQVAFDDARRNLDDIAVRRGWNLEKRANGRALLDALDDVIHIVDADTYTLERDEAWRRIATRDSDDWPIAATALVISAPIWTEDNDFFGTGIATWTTDRVELYLSDERPPRPPTLVGR